MSAAWIFLFAFAAVTALLVVIAVTGDKGDKNG